MAETNNHQFLILSSEFIKNTYLKQCSKEVSRLLSLEPEFDWNIITEVNLSSLNIVHICNFTLVTNLKYLKMTQNKIQKIENLDWLTKLEKLDLSYNRISEIENLEKLTALTYISLNGNNISTLKNLDTISQLQTLFINGNKITNFNELFYLTRFKYLEVLNVMNNPATKNFNLADYEASMRHTDVKFSNLQYFNDKRVPYFMIQQSIIKPDLSLTQIPNNRNKTQDIFIDRIGKQLINHFFRDGNVGKILSNLNKKLNSAFLEYKKQIIKNANTLSNMNLKR